MIEILPSSGRSLIRRNIEEHVKTKVATLQMNKPVLSPEVERAINGALARYKKKSVWSEWGLTYLRKQGSTILLEGPPGCGKTMVVRYMCTRMKYGLKEVSLSDFGSQIPGENERNIEVIFKEATRDDKAVFLDEADAILWNRDRITDNKWMAAVINKLLVEIDRYPHPLFLATNRPQDLDPALRRRILAHIYVGKPDFHMRLAIWRQKIPKKYPWQPSEIQLQELAQWDLTGAEIENTIVEASGLLILDDKKPTFEFICNVAKERAQMIAINEAKDAASQQK